MKTLHRALCGLLLAAVLACGPLTTPRADARVLLTEAALETSFCAHCVGPPGSELVPPSEGQIEGPCGLAISPAGTLYVADYYHRVIDAYALPEVKNPFQPAQYRSHILLPGTPDPLRNSLNGICGLAFDSLGNLYGNELHGGIGRLSPTTATIDHDESTGLAIDRSASRLYVDDRTHLAEYQLPYSPGDLPHSQIGLGHLQDAYGLAASAGLIYVADAGDQSVKVFKPEAGQPASLTEPLATLAGHFTSLKDASLAVDPTNGHLLVVDNAQPGYEHPRAAILEFDSPASGFAYLGQLPGAPVFGAPSGIVVSPAGRVIVTDGNSELSNVFLYGAYAEAGPAIQTTSSVATQALGLAVAVQPAAPTAAHPGQTSTRHSRSRTHRHHRRHAHRHQRGRR